MSRRGSKSSGSFRQDLYWLLEELSKPAIIELGKPAPDERFLPGRAGDCPATHNRLLLDEMND